jgi:hypothetical protein
VNGFEEVKLFPEEGSAEGCASGECLPESPPIAPPAPRAATARDDVTRPLADRWRDVVDLVRQSSPRHGASLAHARLLWIRPGEVAIAYTSAAGFHKATVTAPTAKASLEKLFATHFGRPTLLKVETQAAPTDGEAPTIAEQEAVAKATRERETEAQLRGHPALRATLKILGGEIEHIQMLEPAPSPAVEPGGPDESA